MANIPTNPNGGIPYAFNPFAFRTTLSGQIGNSPRSPFRFPSQFFTDLNLTKNSSLAVAIGYPDLVHVFMGTTLNQTGQAIEVIFITMLVYLVISLVTSALMNWYNRRVAIVER